MAEGRQEGWNGNMRDRDTCVKVSEGKVYMEGNGNWFVIMQEKL